MALPANGTWDRTGELRREGVKEGRGREWITRDVRNRSQITTERDGRE